MLEQFGIESALFIELSKQSFPIVLMLFAVVWGINLLDWSTGSKLHRLGLIPRTPLGLIGILFAPIMHSGFTHLFFNSFPFIALATFIMNRSIIEFIWATIFITFISGFCIWLFGRRGNHIGASGLIAGYFSYVLMLAYERPTFTTLLCAVLALYYFTGILLSFIPSEESTSWEGHLFGLLSGIVTLWIIYYNPFFQLRLL